MPRINPTSLLQCLSVLLGPHGGIKDVDQVSRMFSLMVKFSKKLVSRCIYIQILKSTEATLLVEFMAGGGWALVFQWLDEGIVSNNYPFIKEVLQLLILCPISLDRLKENNCPKVVKGLSKDSEDQEVRQLAGKLVDQWLKFIKSGQAAITDAITDPAPAPHPPPPATSVISRFKVPRPSEPEPEYAEEEEEEEEDDDKLPEQEPVPAVSSLRLYKITVRNGKSIFAKVGTKVPPLVINSVNAKTEESRGVEKKLSAKIAQLGKIPRILKLDKGDSATPVEAKALVPMKDRHSSTSSSSSSVKSGTKDREKSDRSDKDKSDNKHKEKRDSKDHRDRDRKKSEKRDEHRSSSKSDSHSHKDKEKHRRSDKDKERPRDRDKDTKAKESVKSSDKQQTQADKDKDTLERVKLPAISTLGKIPKKSSAVSPATKQSEEKRPAGTEPSKTRPDEKKPSGAEAKSRFEEKKTRPEERRPPSSDGKLRAAVKNTVKSFNSKFRSTGLEEEVKPPPARKTSVDKPKPDRPKTELGKHPSSAPKDGSPLEKKSKVAEIMEKKDKIVDKPGGIKLIPPKPKHALLESDMFSDALTASAKIEPRKRKRRTSNSKDSAPEAKKETKEEVTSTEVTSPRDVKPPSFYKDILEDEESNQPLSELKQELKVKEEDVVKEEKRSSPREADAGPRLYPRGVLTVVRRRGPKKSVKWKEDSQLTSTKFFELDETERTNVTRNFGDMKLIERSNEREAFQLSRKQSVDDVMEEKISWCTPILVDCDKQIHVEPGKQSQEKNVQYAREKTALQAIYFSKSSIPDSPMEPDPEHHPTTDPKPIPVDDITGNSDSVVKFDNLPWPEPKVLAPTTVTPVSPQPPGPPHAAMHQGYTTIPGYPGAPVGPGPIGPPMVPMMQGIAPQQGTWRTADGQEVPIAYPAAPQMMPPMAPMGPMYPVPPEGYPMNGPMGPPPGGFPPNYMGADPNMYGPAPQWNRGWQGPPPRGPGPPMKMPPPRLCYNFSKYGNCARGNSCRFMHPGLNCPPLT